MVRSAILLALVATTATAYADDECDYYGDYNNPDDYDTCFIDTSAPEGCPIHVVATHGVTPTVSVMRDGAAVPVDVTMATEASFASVIDTIDVYSCDCASEQIALDLDAVAVTVSANVGDVVMIEGIFGSGELTVTAADTCMVPIWPTTVRGHIACDLCPVDPEPPQDGSSGCSSSGGGGIVLVLLVGGLTRSTKRSDRHSRHSDSRRESRRPRRRLAG